MSTIKLLNEIRQSDINLERIGQLEQKVILVKGNGEEEKVKVRLCNEPLEMIIGLTSMGMEALLEHGKRIGIDNRLISWIKTSMLDYGTNRLVSSVDNFDCLLEASYSSPDMLALLVRDYKKLMPTYKMCTLEMFKEEYYPFTLAIGYVGNLFTSQGLNYDSVISDESSYLMFFGGSMRLTREVSALVENVKRVATFGFKESVAKSMSQCKNAIDMISLTYNIMLDLLKSIMTEGEA